MQDLMYITNPKREQRTEEWYKKNIFTALKEGDVFLAPHDLYTSKNHMKNHYSYRKVVKFYRHYVLTLDESGRTETYQYFDIWEILNEAKTKKKGGESYDHISFGQDHGNDGL